MNATDDHDGTASLDHGPISDKDASHESNGRPQGYGFVDHGPVGYDSHESSGRPQGYGIADHGSINDTEAFLMNSPGDHKGTPCLIINLSTCKRYGSVADYQRATTRAHLVDHVEVFTGVADALACETSTKKMLVCQRILRI